MEEFVEIDTMRTVKVDVVCENFGQQALPEYSTRNASGCDLRADLKCPMVVPACRSLLVPTGLKIRLPFGYEAQVRSRSGLALREGIIVLNSPGTIDADYRGEIKVILYNTTDIPFTIYPGDRIAQLVVAPFVQANFVEGRVDDDTDRGDGGFGHSGIK